MNPTNILEVLDKLVYEKFDLSPWKEFEFYIKNKCLLVGFIGGVLWNNEGLIDNAQQTTHHNSSLI